MKLLIKVKCDINEFINYTFNNNIDIFDIKNNNDYITCYIFDNDLNKISKYYKVNIIKNYSYKYFINKIKDNIINYCMIVFAIILFYFLTNIIVDVSIESNNMDLVKDISKELDDMGIRRLSYKKNFIELIDVKNKLLNDYKDKLEWIEIQNIGMSYVINFEERKQEINEINASSCDVVAISSGTISKIISSSGVVLAKKYQTIKEGDILISGHITLNDEEKANICAKGDVYAEKWYTVSVELPKKYSKKEYTNKYRYNILIENNNIDYKIFKSRLKNYDTDKSEIISLLGKKLYLLKEYEYKNTEYMYEDSTLEDRINELISQKLELNLSKNEKIISKNVLKKEENNSKILLELFVTIEKLVSKQVTY